MSDEKKSWWARQAEAAKAERERKSTEKALAKRRADSVIVRTYKTAKEFEKDAKKLAKQGYTPSLQSHAAIPKGLVGRVGNIGTFGVFGSANKSEMTVTYTRPVDT